jgi:hypothetical protein
MIRAIRTDKKFLKKLPALPNPRPKKLKIAFQKPPSYCKTLLFVCIKKKKKRKKKGYPNSFNNEPVRFQGLTVIGLKGVPPNPVPLLQKNVQAQKNVSISMLLIVFIRSFEYRKPFLGRISNLASLMRIKNQPPTMKETKAFPYDLRRYMLIQDFLNNIWNKYFCFFPSNIKLHSQRISRN